MREKLTLKNPPQKLESKEEELDVAAEKKVTSAILDNLRQKLFNAGLTTADASAEWRRVYTQKRAILETLNAYESAPEKQKKAILKTYKAQMARLQGKNTDDIHKRIQEDFIKRPKEKNTESLPQNEDDLSEKTGAGLEEAFNTWHLPKTENASTTEDTTVQLTPLEKRTAAAEARRSKETLRKLVTEFESRNEELASAGKEHTKPEPIEEMYELPPVPPLPAQPESKTVPTSLELRDEGIENAFAKGASAQSVHLTTGPRPPEPSTPTDPESTTASRRQWRKENPSLNELGPRHSGNRHIEDISNGKKLTAEQRAFREYIAEQKSREELAAKRREARSEFFAEKHGLKEVRDAKIAAEREAYLEEKDHHRNVFLRLSPSARRRRSEARARADKATLEWNRALSQLPDTLTPREKMEALIIRKRDTLIGPNALRTQARIDAMEERDKTAFGKFMGGFGWAATAIPKASAWASGKIGGGLFAMFGDKKLKGADLERSQAKYRRAGQVLMGAAIGTTIGAFFAPVSVAAAGGVAGYAAFSTVRNVLSVGYGKIMGDAAGQVYRDNFGSKAKEKYDKAVRSRGPESVYGLQQQQEKEKHGSRKNRLKKEQNVKVITAMAAGGLLSADIGYSFNHLASVQSALNVHPPLGFEAHAHTAGTGSGELLQMKIGGANAENVNLNDADKLFGHFGLMLQRDFAHVPHHSPAVDTYLKLLETHKGQGVDLAHGEDHISRTFGFEGKNGMSEVMHKGDTIMLNKQGQVVIHWADNNRPEHVLISASGKINPNIGDVTEHLRTTHHHLHHAGVVHPEQAVQPHEATHLVRESTPQSPEPVSAPSLSESVARARENAEFTSLTAQHDALATQHDRLAEMYRTNPSSPQYAQMRLQYEQGLADYQRHLDSYAAAHSGALEIKPEAAPTPAEGTPAAVEHSTNLPASINALEHTKSWDEFRGYDAQEVYRTAPDPSELDAVLLRNRFLEVVRESGIQPAANQTVEAYIRTATEAIQNNTFQ